MAHVAVNEKDPTLAHDQRIRDAADAVHRGTRRRFQRAPTLAYLNWGRCQVWRRVVVVVGVLGRSVDARAYLGPRPGRGR